MTNGAGCDTISYSAADLKEALRLWGDDAPDPDPDRRADLERALHTLDAEHALGLWSWGYPNREIAQRLGGSEMRASRFVARAVASVRKVMNGL